MVQPEFELHRAPLFRWEARRVWILWLRACWELIRPADSALAVAGTVIGTRLAATSAWSPLDVVCLALSNGLLSGASMAFNDWRDVNEDSIDKPDRPIPSCRLLRSHALGLAAMLFLIGILAAFLVHPVSGTAAGAITLLSMVYTLRLKRIPLVGNAVVALISSYPLWCWLPISNRPGFVPFTLAAGLALFRLGAELVKVAEDHRGDSACGIRTLATLAGVRSTNLIGTSLMCAGQLAFWLPAFAGQASALYSCALSIAGLLSIAGWLRALGPSDSRTSHHLVSLERAIMAMMSLALLL